MFSVKGLGFFRCNIKTSTFLWLYIIYEIAVKSELNGVCNISLVNEVLFIKRIYIKIKV